MIVKTTLDYVKSYALSVLKDRHKADRYVTRAQDEIAASGLLVDIALEAGKLVASCLGTEGARYQVATWTEDMQTRASCSCPAGEHDAISDACMLPFTIFINNKTLHLPWLL